MQRPIMRLLAASVCLAIAGYWLFAPGGQSVGYAFNRFAKAVVAAKSARFQMEVQIEGQPKQKFRAVYLAPGKFRQELGNMVNIADFTTGKMVSILPAEKKVVIMTISGGPANAQSANYFEKVRELLADSTQAKAGNFELLGEKDIQGTRAVGFRSNTPAADMTLWGDPATGFPVRIENVWSGLPRTETSMTNFEFNVEVDASKFDTTPPAGYKIQKFEIDGTPATEPDLIKALSMCAELSGGSFPDSADTT
ncbi:MAG: outer membrane lipoprotein carrier protein LolA, partial [Planctomycetes bacterium]|nr:outer membrane lipoprotein carrier protein LolA [Planctomycetota bacterium]